jgi:antitoxin (DNA-binding transcriptional repressor) of toxin-antitoxin stability system
MVAVGVRQLKNSLTRYLRLVEEGHSVLVTSRNRPVAVLRKPDRNTARTQEEVIAALVAEGKLLPAEKPGPLQPFKPRKLRGKPFSQSIIEDRR